ncbi:MAG: DNA alkylation repair protein [Candidatus Omnitrophica bacterium]|nr:DNA alkylation repair protein [Candidatus Omnitrophota bacterium]
MKPLILPDFRTLADPEKAKILQGFFKTGPGEYGEGDIFLGITVPKIRAFAKTQKPLSLEAIASMLYSVYHEERLLALILLVNRFKKSDETGRQIIFDLYVRHTPRINNWDLVDLSAPYIVGPFLFNRPRKALYALADSADLWERRVAIVATFAFIRNNDFTDTLKIAAKLLNDKADLIHKAVGWMLREVGKRDQKILEDFLKTRYLKMPRTMLRYAIERFEEKHRQAYLQNKI